jgi:hypothetical protein
MNTYNNPILNKIWQLLMGFVVWKIWKERNRRVFHSKPSSMNFVWSNIFDNTQEIVRSQKWYEQDLTRNPNESIILS